MIHTFVETPIERRARYIFVGAVAGRAAAAGLRRRRIAGLARQPRACGRGAHRRLLSRDLLDLGDDLLLTPALCFHIFSSPPPPIPIGARCGPPPIWRSWSISAGRRAGVCGGDLHVVLHSQVATPAFPECLIEHPRPDFFLAAWWGLDVVLAWLITDNHQMAARRARRGAHAGLHHVLRRLRAGGEGRHRRASARHPDGDPGARLPGDPADRAGERPEIADRHPLCRLLPAAQSVRALAQAADAGSRSPISARCARCCAQRTCTTPPTSR